MKKILIIMTLFSLFFISGLSSVHAQDQIILKYEFEEGGGSIIFDSSGNGFLAVNTNANWVTNPVTFGTYALDFDGSNDYIETTLPLDQTTRFAVGGWIYLYSTSQDTIMDIDNGGTNKFQLQIQGGNTQLVYRDDTSTLQTLVLESGNIATGVYHHITLYVDSSAETYTYWRNGAIISTGTIPNGYNSFASPETIRIGADLDENEDLDAVLDSLFVINFEPTSDQITEMIEQNVMTIEIETPIIEEVNLDGYIFVDTLIENYNPFQNEEFSSTAQININLNVNAKCEFYLNSLLYRHGENLTSYSWTHDLNFGEYVGNFYCYYDYNNTRYYDITEEFPFSIIAGNDSQINFFIKGIDYDVADENLYITTPCLKHIMSAGEMTKNTDAELNKGKSIYVQKLSNGQATFNLDNSEHEFCLINGNIQYNENTFTDDFNINKIEGLVNLGSFNVPSNITQSYEISTELLEIYDKVNPKAWGQTWTGIIGGLILLILGALILLSGVYTNNGKIVIGGVILCVSAMGISLSGFVGLLI